MSKHTPGPWRATGPTGQNMQSYSQPWGVVGTGEYAATLICGCFGDTRGGIEAAEANARLIAAAPELLEALEGVTRILEAFNYTMRLGETQVARINAARAAIAKAKGE